MDYIDTPDTTLAGSRSGHAPLVMWYALNVFGTEGLRERAQECWRVAAYTVQRLTEIDWPAWRHPYAMTVVLDTPPTEVTQRFSLASSNGQSHIITMPHVTTQMIDMFAEHLAALKPRPSTMFAAWPAPRDPAFAVNGNGHPGDRDDARR